MPSAYVTLHPHPCVEKITTVVVQASSKPIWNHQCTTKIPTLHLQPQVCINVPDPNEITSPYPLQSPGLEVQVWSAKDARQPSELDTCIGCVTVDLTPLTFGLAQLSGWYNILDFAGQVQGQVKASWILAITTYKSPKLQKLVTK